MKDTYFLDNVRNEEPPVQILIIKFIKHTKVLLLSSDLNRLNLIICNAVLHRLANFIFIRSVSRNSFLHFKVIVSVAKDDKWYSAIDS